jgi:hypothetical protein
MTDTLLHTLTPSCWCGLVAQDGHVNEDGSRPGQPDLDDTSRCPVADRCATCSTEQDLAVATAATRVGVHCFTLCGGCADRGTLPSLGWFIAMAGALDHCEHLGIDLDEMAAAIAAERVEAVAR